MADFTYFCERGPLPLLVSMPHVGTQIPPELLRRMTPQAKTLADTDWRLPGFTTSCKRWAPTCWWRSIRATSSTSTATPKARCCIRAPAYRAGALTTFQSEPIYREGQAPDQAEIAHRVGQFWRPYHLKLAEELAAIKARHGYALLFDAHSIKSELPRFFEGRLWDINLGTADGASAAPAIGAALLAAAQRDANYTSVLNGRFKGGYITRTYGAPKANVHAAQLELSWRTYMDESGPFAFDEGRADAIRPLLRRVIDALLDAGARAGAA